MHACATTNRRFWQFGSTGNHQIRIVVTFGDFGNQWITTTTIHQLGEKLYYPNGAEVVVITDYLLFLSNTAQHNKEVVLRSMTQRDGVVTIVFATVALGVGVNLRDVNMVAHYGAPSSIDNYFQESGRWGCSGDEAKSVVYWKPLDCPVGK